jgi:hypothetical protein
VQSSSDDWYRDNHGDGFLPSRPLKSVKPDEHQPLRACPSPTPRPGLTAKGTCSTSTSPYAGSENSQIWT